MMRARGRGGKSIAKVGLDLNKTAKRCGHTSQAQEMEREKEKDEKDYNQNEKDEEEVEMKRKKLKEKKWNMQEEKKFKKMKK